MTLPADRLTVTFDRIGRTHNVPPLHLGAADTRDWDAVTEAIERHARPYLLSRFPEVVINERPKGVIAGRILCGFNSGGTFKIEETTDGTD